MEATDEEVVNTLSRKTHAPQILAKMEGEILRVEKLEAESPEEGRKLQRSSVLMNLDTLKSIDSDSDRHEEVPVKPSRSNFEEKTTVVRKNPFDEEDDETKYSLSGSNDGKVEEVGSTKDDYKLRHALKERPLLKFNMHILILSV